MRGNMLFTKVGYLVCYDDECFDCLFIIFTHI